MNRTVTAWIMYSFVCQGALAQGGDVYSWVDKDGTFHFVDSIELVPVQFRSEAVPRAESKELAGDGAGGAYNRIHIEQTSNVTNLESPAVTEAVPAPSAATSRPDPAAPATPATVVGTDREYWQSRILLWRQKKRSAEEELQKLDETFFQLRALPQPNVAQLLAEAEAKRETLLQTIAEADRMIEDEIPREARRAGIPPGWLRE